MDDDAGSTGRLGSRVTCLESTLAHYQRDYEVLNQVVVDQAAEIDNLQRRLDRLETTLHEVQQHLPNERSPEDERPPHY